MLKKFRAKGEYLYVGLFVISLTAISYNPIQHYINKDSEKIKIQSFNINNQNLIIEDNNSLNIAKKIHTSINILGGSFKYKKPKDKLYDLETSYNGKYKYITLDNLYKNQDYHNIFFKDKKADLLTARKLSNYISSNYKITLDNAELIVLDTYKESIHNNLEPLLLLSLIGTESSYRKNNISVVGAVGLTQVLPTYHESKIKQLKKQNLDLWSIKGNIKVGSLILKEYLELSNGNMANALQRYNGSLGDKTYKYSNKVFSKMNILENIAKT